MNNKKLNIILTVLAVFFLFFLVSYSIYQKRIWNGRNMEIKSLENLQFQLYRESSLLLPTYMEPLDQSSENYKTAVFETRRLFLELENSKYLETINNKEHLILKDLRDYRKILEGYQDDLLQNLDTSQLILSEFIKDHPLNIKSINDFAKWRRILREEETLAYSDFFDYEIVMNIQNQNMALSIGIRRIDKQIRDYESDLIDLRRKEYTLLGLLFLFSALPLILLAFNVFSQNRFNKSIAETRSRFFSSVSHELRTPMNVIIGLVQLMSKAVLPEKERDRLNKIDRTSQDLLSLINDVLDYSKLDADKMKLENKPYSPEALVLHIAEMFSSPLAEKKLTLVKEFESPLPWVYGDDFRIRQVITNLMSNALKFTSEGSITLGVKYVLSPDKAEHIVYYVKDTGIGIPQEKKDSLFVPFNQADDSTSRQFGGTGLGLSISNKFVRLMHGRIRVEGKYGEGSTFFVELPCRPASHEDISHEKESININKKAKEKYIYPGSHVLLVEDHPINREIMTELLEEKNIQITLAVNGRDGIKKWENGKFDLILMDIQMPGMNGLEACKEIRKRETNKSHIPIIALTAHAMTEDKTESRESGMDGHLTKPIILNELLHTLDLWLGSYRSVRDKKDAAASPDIELIQTELPEIRIADAQRMINRNISVYFDLLLQALTDGSVKIENLKDCLQLNNLEDARIICHSLKGTLGTLKVDELYTIIVNMEEGLLNNLPPSREDIDILVGKFSSLEQRLRAVMEKIE